MECPYSQAPSELRKLPTSEIDVLVVGAGFSGLYLLHQLRRLSFSAKIFEAAPSIGGVWHWNSYPGCRTDSDYHIYQLSLPELWKDWTWKERYPSREELLAYFEHIEKKLDLKKDIIFKTRVLGAKFDSTTNRWTVRTSNGITARPRFLVMCIGNLSKPLFPQIPGLDTFKGSMHHTALWPQDGVDLRGKRVGVVGTGASGVQIIQAIAPTVKHLTVFQRTPNFALPLRQKKLDTRAQEKTKDILYPLTFRRCRQTFGGWHYEFVETPLLDTLEKSPEKVQLDMENWWEQGGFRLWLGSYPDVLSDVKANQVTYQFWRQKVLGRVRDKEMQDKLAPENPPHLFGIKRPALEEDYFDTFNLPHVSLVDVSKSPVVAAQPNALVTSDGTQHDLDVLVLATGFDAVTGGMTGIQLEGTDGRTVGEKWKEEGIRSYLGMATDGFPNMFFIYGPHGPTAFCNAPTCGELQADWVCGILSHLRSNSLSVVEPKPDVVSKYSKALNEDFEQGLWMTVKSQYNGAIVPGKRVESMNFTGGVPKYRQLCEDEERSGYAGFIMGPDVVQNSALRSQL